MILLRAKNVEFKVTYINLQDKPDWFLDISPHGKVPVLVVDEVPLFESNAIAEYLDEVVLPRCHPQDPIERAQNRAWTDFVGDFAKALSGTYYTKSRAQTDAAIETSPKAIAKLEAALASRQDNGGPYFNGPDLSLVDAAYAPFLQRFALVEPKLGTNLLKDFPLVQAWSDALLANEVISGAVVDSFAEKFVASLKRREFYVAALFETTTAAAAE